MTRALQIHHDFRSHDDHHPPYCVRCGASVSSRGASCPGDNLDALRRRMEELNTHIVALRCKTYSVRTVEGYLDLMARVSDARAEENRLRDIIFEAEVLDLTRSGGEVDA